MAYRALGLALGLVSIVEPASAHGPPPAATELLARSGASTTLVRLTPGGFAQRVPDGFRFVCPEAWGGDVLAPAAALTSGPLLIASDMLFVVEPGGRISPHPIQAGTGIVVASHREAVFGVFKHDGQAELRRVTQATNDLVRVLDQPFGALVATDSEIAGLRWLDRTLELQRMSLSGELRGSVTWSVPNTVAYARLRAVGDSLYVVVWGRSAPWVSLGRMTASGYEPLREASTDIAGPVALAEGTAVALDGALEMLEGGTTLDAHGAHVTCLGTADGQPYACAHGDLMGLEARNFGAPLFELTSLREPDYPSLAAADRPDCTTRWLDLREHVASSGSSSTDAGVTVADAATDDAGELTPSTAKPTGCSLGTGTGHTGSLCALVLLTLAARRRSTPRRRTGRVASGA